MNWLRSTLAAVLLVTGSACGSGETSVTSGAYDAANPELTTSSDDPVTTTASVDEPVSQPILLRSFTMAFTGDFLLHNRVNATAATNASSDPSRSYDYRPMLEPIRSLVEGADWAVCHMEVNLSADNTRLQPFPVFRSPGQIALDARDLGYDSCTVASNHVLDHGVDGVAETLEVLEAAGLRSTGSARSAAEAAGQIWTDIGGIQVAHLSYTYGFNGFSLPSDALWTSNLIDEDQILADAGRARADGAEFVVLSLHWGEQYLHQPDSQQADLGPRLLASPDVDLIIGHHAHVVQPIENLNGEWLIYGLGNLLSGYSQPARQDELFVQTTVTEQLDGTFSTELRAVPLYVDNTTLAVYPSNPATRSAAVSPALAAELDASWSRVSVVLEAGSGWEHLSLG